MNAFVIERDKLVGNIECVKKRAGGVKVFAVVKGDGYGFGLEPFVRLLHESGITSFAVTEPEEVERIRGLGLEAVEILMLRSTALAEEVESLIRNRAVLTIGSQEAAVAANGIAGKLGVCAPVHIKIDTGMGRYGFQATDTEAISSVFTYMHSLKVCGMYTHLNCAFSKKKRTLEQIDALTRVEARLREEGFDPGMIHFANSSVLFQYDIDLRDAVRIGSALTGRLAFPCRNSGLQKVGYLESQVCEIRWLPKGATVGYGGAFRARRPVRAAVIPLGYSHGFGVEKVRDTYRLRDGIRYVLQDVKRTLTGEKLYVEINGKPARVLGHVGMLHTVVDVTELECSIGDRAVFELSPLYVDGLVEKQYVE